MSLLEDEQQHEEEAADGVVVCPDCGEEFDGKTAKVKLGLHRRNVHGVQSKRAEKNARAYAERKETTPRREGVARIRRELKKNATAAAMIPFALNGTVERLANPAVQEVIDKRADDFANSWAAVAEQSDWVRDNLTQLLSGGVWIAAAISTAGFVYSTAVFAGYAPLHPGLLMVMPDMRQFVPPPGAVPTPPPTVNGNGDTAA